MRYRWRYRWRAFVIAGWIRSVGYEEALRRAGRRGWIERVDKDWGIYLR